MDWSQLGKNDLWVSKKSRNLLTNCCLYYKLNILKEVT
jgi:hypothetical protein